MKKRWWIIGSIIVVGLLIALAVSSQKEPVAGVQLQRENVVATLTVTGEVRADTAVSFSPPVTARITAITVDEGDVIKPGQLLVQLDTEQTQEQLQQAIAQAQQAQAAYADVRQGTRPEQIRLWEERYREASLRVKQAQVTLQETQARQTDAVNNAKRFESLFKQELVSEQEYDSAQLQAQIATQETDRLRTELNASRRQRDQITAQLAEARHGPTHPEVMQAAAAAQAAQANAKAIRERLADYRILSGMNGIVTERMQDPGDLAQPGQAVLKAANPTTLQVVCQVEENDLTKLRVGDQAYVVLDALPETALEGKILRIGSQVNPTNGTVETRVILNDNAFSQLKALRLLPGMTADVNVITDHLNQALVLPATAIRSESGQLVVYQFIQNRLVKQPIEARRISMENYLITGGLQPGAWVAAIANPKLADKKNVKPVSQETLPQPPKPSGGMAAP
ncbi:MAG: hlyD [Vampirovibrio sp.]|jgi:multidrug efflux pump subunit AcrA (membrane-fusion protein)|nr:hlyD [Vampirovibrio sp.]